MEFSRQEDWSGYPFSSLGDIPDTGIKSGSPALQADPLPSKPQGKSPNLVMNFAKVSILKVYLFIFLKSQLFKFPSKLLPRFVGSQVNLDL